MTDGASRIVKYLDDYGILLCNENKYLPSLFSIGADWSSLVSMIDCQRLFYSKIYRKRVCYLSPSVYFSLKRYRQTTCDLPPYSLNIFELLTGVGPLCTREIKEILMISTKTFTMHANLLMERMLVTAIERNSDISASWSSFVWGTYSDWEKKHDENKHDYKQFDSEKEVALLLGKLLSKKEVERLFSKI